MASPIREKHFDLRTWQAEAFRSVLANLQDGKKDFLCVATPGAGKTKFALRVVHYFLQKQLADRVVIVTPTEGLKNQWAETAAVFAGLDVDPDFKNSMGHEAYDYHGMAVTYALLGQDKHKVHAQNTFRQRTFVVFDEIHHCGNREHLTWGAAVRNSFEDAVFRLSISGTAFRSDDAPIPFVNYDSTNTSVADYTYSYERAIRENVCRPVYFAVYDGEMRWRVGNSEFTHSFKDSLTPDQVSKRLKTALDPKGNWIKKVLQAADDKLTGIRVHHPDAAGLVFAATQKHANDIAQVLGTITGKVPPVVVSDQGDGSERIEEFRKGKDKWLVSVKMVSEGVDIPRLRVGVYLTNVKAELFFRQAVGRFVRVLQHLQSQDAFVFIPQDKELVKLAESIQEERDHALDEAKKSANAADQEQTDLFGNYIPALTGKFIPLGSEATNNKVIAVNVEIGTGGMRTSVDHRKITEQNPIYMQKQNLRDRLNVLSKRYAISASGGGNNRPDFKLAHKKWIEAGGKAMELETVDELKRRVTFYENLIRSTQR